MLHANQILQGSWLSRPFGARGIMLRVAAFILMALPAVGPSDAQGSRPRGEIETKIKIEAEPKVEVENHNRDGGIGGTGIVFGTIDQLGSIFVNGLKIETSRTNTMSYPEGLGDGSFAPGDTVFVEIEAKPDGIFASRLVQFFPISGPVTAVAPHELFVMGTRITIPRKTPIVDPLGRVVPVRAGQTVRVSGIWRQDRVIASRIVVGPNIPATLSGQVRPRHGGIGIGATSIILPPQSPSSPDSAALGKPKLGAFVSVEGEYRQKRFRPRIVRTGLPWRLDQLNAPLVAQGYLARDFSGPGFHLSGFGLPMNQASPIPRTIGARAVFFGKMGGSFLIESQVPVSPSPVERAEDLLSLRRELIPPAWRGFYQR